MITQHFEKFKFFKYMTDNYRVIFLEHFTRVMCQTRNSLISLELTQMISVVDSKYFNDVT